MELVIRRPLLNLDCRLLRKFKVFVAVEIHINSDIECCNIKENLVPNPSSANSNSCISKNKPKEAISMSNSQVAIPEKNTAVASANREEESEYTEETTLSEVKKDLKDSKYHEKTAKFESEETTSLVEDNRSRQTEASKSVMQQESSEVSANRKVTSSRIETSESFSMEETEEFEIEG